MRVDERSTCCTLLAVRRKAPTVRTVVGTGEKRLLMNSGPGSELRLLIGVEEGGGGSAKIVPW